MFCRQWCGLSCQLETACIRKMQVRFSPADEDAEMRPLVGSEMRPLVGSRALTGGRYKARGFCIVFGLMVGGAVGWYLGPGATDAADADMQQLSASRTPPTREAKRPPAMVTSAMTVMPSKPKRASIWTDPSTPATVGVPHPGFRFLGAGHIKGHDVRGAPQPGNVSSLECARICRRSNGCAGFAWFPKPSWSVVSECYLKDVDGGCPLTALEPMDGVYTWQHRELCHASRG